MTSLRARLLVFVLLAILATAVLQAALAYRAARAEADQIFDYHMQQTALSLRAGLPQALATGVIPLPAEEQDFDFVLQIWTLDGVRVFESAARAELPQRAVIGFDDVGAHGTRYRVYSLQARSFVIQVAQDMSVRQRMAGSLALRTALPILLLAPLLMGLVGWVISRSLAPVARGQRQGAERQADDLTEVAETGLPTRCARWCRSSTACCAVWPWRLTRSSVSWPTPRTSCARRWPRSSCRCRACSARPTTPRASVRWSAWARASTAPRG
jgi:two-component system OmpR family sensor kinase